MLKIFIGQPISGKSYLPILYPNLGSIDKPQRLFFNYVKAFPEKMLDVVDDPSVADYLMIPHDYFSVTKYTEFIRKYTYLAEKYGKKILIFDHSDYDSDINVPHSIIFRVSRYRHQLKNNEVIMPPIIEDLGVHGISIRKKNAKPVVGFCGFAGFRNISDRIKYIFKNIYYEINSLFNRRMIVHKPGLYFRRMAMSVIKKSDKVNSDFIVRSSYSGHSDSIELDPVVARREYIQNIVNSDFVLCPKGDGNYSNRFYEVLSLGRIPILIDTECVLPIESDIPYEEFIIRIPYGSIGTFVKVILKKFESITDSEYRVMQMKARDIFVKRLNASVFFQRVFYDLSFLKKFN